MTSCPPTPHQRSHRFRSAVEVAEGLDLQAQSALEDPRVILVPPDLPDPRVILVPPDQKAPEVFRVLLDLLAVELEEPLYLVPKDREAQLALLDRREIREFRVLLDQRGITVFPALLVPLEQMVNQDPRVRTVLSVLPALLDRRVLPDLPESVAPPARMQSPLSSTSISPRMRRPRPTARRPMSKMHYDRPIPSRMALGTTLQ